MFNILQQFLNTFNMFAHNNISVHDGLNTTEHWHIFKHDMSGTQKFCSTLKKGSKNNILYIVCNCNMGVMQAFLPLFPQVIICYVICGVRQH